MTQTRKQTERYQRVDRIEVRIWGETVGAVALDPALNFYVFAFEPKFARKSVELAPLKMPVNTREDLFIFPDLPELTYKRLPAMLADALPDDFGNALIDRYMADKGIARENITPLDRLAYMGARGIGALEFKPQRGPQRHKPTAIKLGELVSEARKAVLGSFENDDHANATLRSIIDVGTSAGGARAKAVIAWNEETNEIRSGQMDVPTGFSHWLLKFDGMGQDTELGTSQDYGRIEYAYYLMARQAGIRMMESRLLTENGRSHFMTRRFDRDGAGVKHHVQSLCAMAHLDYRKKSTNGYSQLFMTIRQLKLGRESEVEAFRRMAFNVMARNCDDHTKNFAFLLKKGGAWELAPAYDVTFAHNPKGEWTSQHLMSVNGKYKDFTIDDLMAEAERFGIGEAPDIVKTVRSTIEAWPDFSKTAGVSSTVRDHIRSLHVLFD